MYNGYKNYATWSVLNYISTDETAYNHYMKVYHDNGDDVNTLASVLAEDFTADKIIDPNASTLHAVYKDILEDAISEVDFAKVAEAFVE